MTYQSEQLCVPRSARKSLRACGGLACRALPGPLAPSSLEASRFEPRDDWRKPHCSCLKSSLSAKRIIMPALFHHVAYFLGHRVGRVKLGALELGESKGAGEKQPLCAPKSVSPSLSQKHAIRQLYPWALEESTTKATDKHMRI